MALSSAAPAQMIRVKRKRIQDPPDIIFVEGACDKHVGNNDDSRAVKRQTIGRASGKGAVRKGLGGLGGAGRDRSRGGGGDIKGERSFVLRRVTLRKEESKRLEKRVASGVDMDKEMASKDAGSNDSRDTRPNKPVVSGTSDIQSGGMSKKARSRKSLGEVNSTYSANRSPDAGQGCDGNPKLHHERRRRRRIIKTKEKEGFVQDRSWDGAGSQPQDLRDEMLEYATSQMAAVDFGSEVSSNKINGRTAGIKDEKSKHKSPPEEKHHRTNHEPTTPLVPQRNQKPGHKAVPKPKQRPNPKQRHEDGRSTSNSRKATAKKSKADLKAAAIMQAFAIDTTNHDSNTFERDRNSADAKNNPTSKPNSQQEEMSQERRLKRPGASTAEKAWRLRNWKAQRIKPQQQYKKPQDVPVLTLAAEPGPSHRYRHRDKSGSISEQKNATAASFEDEMDIDSANHQTSAKNGNLSEQDKCKNGKNDSQNDSDDDGDPNSDTYDIYICEPKSHLVDTDYKSANVGYLTISSHHRNSDKNNDGSSINVSSTTDTNSISANQLKYNDSATSRYWNTVWDSWDAELELEAEIEKRLQVKVDQYQNHRNQYNSHHHPQQQEQQHHEMPTHEIQQLREHIRAQLQRQRRYAIVNHNKNNNNNTTNKYNSCADKYSYRDNQDDSVLSDSSSLDKEEDEYADQDEDEEDENAENHWAADYPDEEDSLGWHRGRSYHLDAMDNEFDLDDVERAGMMGMLRKRGSWDGYDDDDGDDGPIESESGSIIESESEDRD